MVCPDQVAAFGAGWAQPSNGLQDNEYVLEASYTWQITPGLSLTSDLQALFNRTKYPTENMVFVGGLRSILTL